MRQPVHIFDPPGPFDTLETWEQFFNEVQSLAPSATRDVAIRKAKRAIASKKQEKGTGGEN